MVSDYLFTAALEAELNDIMAGDPAGYTLPWSGRDSGVRLKTGSVGVVWKEPRHSSDPVQPLVLVARHDDHRRLFGRFSQLRGDLSPLSTWCHLIEPDRFATLDFMTREADLGGLEAAWTGLVVAEALLLAERSISNLRIAACMATQSFGIARAKALWDPITIGEIMGQYDSVQALFRTGESRMVKLRTVLEPIWACLIGVSAAKAIPSNRELSPIIKCLRNLNDARQSKDNEEEYKFVEPLRELVPEAEVFERLPLLTPEERVREFDKIVKALDQTARGDSPAYRHSLALLAGYLATVAAGGSPSLSLAEANSHRWPEITAWAYVIGSIGERVVWTSSFDGLGRLIARELMRPLRLDEPPTCDFALDEALVLFDPHLADPLVNLRIKQARIVTVALLPGVNVLVPIGDNMLREAKTSESANVASRSDISNRVGAKNDPMAVIADAIWPHLRARMEKFNDSAQAEKGFNRSYKPKKGRANQRSTEQNKLPLKEPNQK
jgi:hypothetical protein